MNNNYLMMLLPFLMANKNGKGGLNLSPEMLINLFSGGKSPGENPMFSLISNMLNNTKKNANKEPPDINSIFGGDVWNILKKFMEMKKTV